MLTINFMTIVISARYKYAMKSAIAVAVACTGVAICSGQPAHADTTQARCDYYPRGEDRASASMACTFSQRQGFITIRRQDGVTHEFRPQGNRANRYVDSQGGQVIRGDAGGNIYTMYRTPSESIYVYWGDRGGNVESNVSATSVATTPAQSATPVTYLTEVNRNRIVMQITEGEFHFHGNLVRTSGNMFVGQDNQVRVMYDRTTKRVVVINIKTGTEFYNYFFSDVDEGAL